jgi:hypothetical protein
MSYFIAYDKKKPAIIWGSGETSKAALKDARATIKQWASWSHIRACDAKRIGLVTIRCDYSVIDFVNTKSGGNVPWAVHKKVAHLIALDL